MRFHLFRGAASLNGGASNGEHTALGRGRGRGRGRGQARIGIARRLIDDHKVSDAIKLLAEVIPTIPADQAGTASVAAIAWDRVSIAHMMVDDVPGYLKAIGRAEDHMAASTYPRPDYDSLYNLAQSLGFLGRHDEALALVEAYGRLAERAGTATATAYAGTCAPMPPRRVRIGPVFWSVSPRLALTLRFRKW